MSNHESTQSASGVPFNPFSESEHTAEQVVELLLTEGGQLLYEHYIDRKSFPYASEVINDVLVGELRMCFVPMDQGENAINATSDKIAVVHPPLGFRHSIGTSDQLETIPDSRPLLAENADVVDGKYADEMVALAQETIDSDCLNANVTSPTPSVAEADVIRNGWDLEPEPPRCRIDTWARSCVPIRRKHVQSKEAPVETDERRKSRRPGNAPRAPSRSGDGIASPPETVRDTVLPKVSQSIPLVEEREDDEEETEMRDKKDREAKRRRDEEAKIVQKQAQEAEEVARLAQVQNQMKNKPFTYDSEGNIVWIQPPNINALPAACPVPTYSFKEGMTPATPGTHHHEAMPRPAPKGPKNKKLGSKKNDEFSDSFKKFASQQPNMLEAMKVVPGVILSCRGKRKAGPNVEHRGQVMSRKAYEEMASSGVSTAVEKQANETVVGVPPALDQLPSARSAFGQDEAVEKIPSILVGADGGSPEGRKVGGMRVVRTSDLGMELVPHAPTAPRPMHPVPQPSFRRVGHYASGRERVPTGTGSRYPNCAAQPPLGATMGHGLSTGSGKPEEFYFPGQPQLLGNLEPLALSVAGLDAIRGESEDNTPASLKTRGLDSTKQQGRIVSANSRLARQLFAK